MNKSKHNLRQTNNWKMRPFQVSNIYFQFQWEQSFGRTNVFSSLLATIRVFSYSFVFSLLAL